MPGNASTAVRARTAATEELTRRGFRAVEETTAFHRRVIRGRSADGVGVLFIIKGRTSGTWQGTTRDGDPEPRARGRVFWLFVDLEPKSPEFYVVPDIWMRRDIHREHSRYLDRHGGQRARATSSTHHAIQMERIDEWRDRWDLLPD